MPDETTFNCACGFGDLYREKRQYVKAVWWYRRAIDQGHAGAQYRLGGLYAVGKGVPQNDTEAVRLTRLAADRGHVPAQYYLGVMYQFGRCVERNRAESVPWYRRAAEQGHVEAQYRLAGAYAVGKSVERDLVRAYMWYTVVKMADAGEMTSGSSRTHLERITNKMSADQIAEAQRLAREWDEAHPRLPRFSFEPSRSSRYLFARSSSGGR